MCVCELNAALKMHQTDQRGSDGLPHVLRLLQPVEDKERLLAPEVVEELEEVPGGLELLHPGLGLHQRPDLHHLLVAVRGALGPRRGPDLLDLAGRSCPCCGGRALWRGDVWTLPVEGPEPLPHL